MLIVLPATHDDDSDDGDETDESCEEGSKGEASSVGERWRMTA